MTGSNSFWFANVDSGFYPEQISQSVRLDGDVSDTKFIYTPSGDGNKKTYTLILMIHYNIAGVMVVQQEVKVVVFM